MLDVGSSELLVIVIVAVLVIGPKDLPRALYKVGQLVGKARAVSRHFRSGIDAMVREVELEELEKKWASENRRIMQQHPSSETDMRAIGAPEGDPHAPPEAWEPEPVPEQDVAVTSGAASPSVDAEHQGESQHPQGQPGEARA